jgi:SAM-dependent methyltransferase
MNKIKKLASGFFFPTNVLLKFFPTFFDSETRGIVNFLISELPDCRTQLLCLDVGAGSKPYKSIIESKGYKYHSLDIIENEKSNHNFIGDAGSIPLTDNSCDVIVSFQTLEHLIDPEKALSEWARVLAPGGIMIITTNFFYPLHGSPADFYRFTKEGLTAILERAGLSSIKTVSRGGPLSLFILTTFYGLRSWEKKALMYSKSLTYFPSRITATLFFTVFIPINTLFVIFFTGLSFADRRLLSEKRYIGVQAVAFKPLN